jgi:hypothetical protein
MKTDAVPPKPKPVHLPATPLPQRSVSPATKKQCLTIAFANEPSTAFLINGQSQQYFLPSDRPLWTNPLNDF